MTRALGIDPSLTGTGVAAIDSSFHTGPLFTVQTIKSFGHKGDSLRARNDRIRRIVDRVTQLALDTDLIVIEGPAYASSTGSVWDRAGLWWSIVDTLLLDHHHVAVAPPTVVKKFAAGKGNAGKGLVSVGMARLWGEECQCANDNEWDALTMATMAGQRLGIPGIPTRAHHTATLDSVAWDTEREAA
ncbi:hypothetical protein ACIBCH_20760 [Amycolatopsis thailandensis]|uniref:hypothetical protein n=1 Tax=Amycolatopsis thailandensis TaxID=589330 RepID=UPI0037910298